ncbi:hypothetical protein [Paenibacillus sp. YPG26]|uniref:hypothetical protein n=1 Tax=Paenibacillus sp. YPG26 TaxID=2878915 RepID=UPI00203B5E03|nr:hypothetical protein [Paenibacillus sp. YPG26]USB34626.1 hypothetical protein LDO05_07670 [Paenibacillus sp. YPG26]
MKSPGRESGCTDIVESGSSISNEVEIRREVLERLCGGKSAFYKNKEKRESNPRKKGGLIGTFSRGTRKGVVGKLSKDPI